MHGCQCMHAQNHVYAKKKVGVSAYAIMPVVEPCEKKAARRFTFLKISIHFADQLTKPNLLFHHFCIAHI